MKAAPSPPSARSLLWEGLLDLLYPPHCLLCKLRLEEGSLCEACLKEMQFLAPYRGCDRCGDAVSANATLCDECQEGRFPSFDWSYGAGHYSGKLRQAIRLLKYQERLALAAPLGKAMSQAMVSPYIQRMPLDANGEPAFDVVVPVPLHSSRHRRRGFNQSERLAQVIANEHGWKLDAQGLRRVRATRSQAELNERERKMNVSGAFQARTPTYFEGRSVLLIDDVITTTATVNECANALKQAGASFVCVAGLARGG